KGASVGLAILDHAFPSQCRMVPAWPTAQASSGAAPQTSSSPATVPLGTGAHASRSQCKIAPSWPTGPTSPRAGGPTPFTSHRNGSGLNQVHPSVPIAPGVGRLAKDATHDAAGAESNATQRPCRELASPPATPASRGTSPVEHRAHRSGSVVPTSDPEPALG